MPRNHLPNQSPANAQPSPALLEANRVLQVDPERAEVLIRLILQSDPADPTARLLLATALRARGRPGEAYPILIALVEQFPDRAAVLYQMGLTLCQQGSPDEGLPFLLSARRLVPDMPGMGRALGDAYRALGEHAAADLAYCEYLAAQPFQPAILEAQHAMGVRKWREAEAILRAHLAAQPEDLLALLMLSDIALAVARMVPALEFLKRVLTRAPSWLPARCARARILSGVGDYQQALVELDAVLALDASHAGALGIKAATLSLMGDFEAALTCRERQRQLQPEDPRVAVFHGNVLRTLGRFEQAVTAYRQSTRLRASFGEGYWSLANLKRFRFEPDEVQRIDRALASPDVSNIDRVYLSLAAPRRTRMSASTRRRSAAMRTAIACGAAACRRKRSAIPPTQSAAVSCLHLVSLLPEPTWAHRRRTLSL